jgi:hypothetical protein
MLHKDIQRAVNFLGLLLVFLIALVTWLRF